MRTLNRFKKLSPKNLKTYASGGAAHLVNVLEEFEKFNVPILEG
jgi:hypothetical protein